MSDTPYPVVQDTAYSFHFSWLRCLTFYFAVSWRSGINCIRRHRPLHSSVPVPVHRSVPEPLRAPCRTVSSLSFCLLTYVWCTPATAVQIALDGTLSVVPYFDIQVYLIAFTHTLLHLFVYPMYLLFVRSTRRHYIDAQLLVLSVYLAYLVFLSYVSTGKLSNYCIDYFTLMLR